MAEDKLVARRKIMSANETIAPDNDSGWPPGGLLRDIRLNEIMPVFRHYINHDGRKQEAPDWRGVTLMNMVAWSREHDRDFWERQVLIGTINRHRFEDEELGRAIYVRVWSRDCDCCESATTTKLPATPEAWTELYDATQDSAEGAFTVTIRTQDEGLADLEAGPTFRDRGLEAFEDGHPHIIYAGGDS